MRVACALIPDFEVAVELSRRPELAGRPVVVGGLPHERKMVRSRSPEAAAYGVTEGMSLRRAQGLCPEAVFLPPDEELYREALDRVLRVLGGFSPTIEVGAASVLSPQSSALVYLDAEGLGLLFGPDRELGARIAAAVEEKTGLRPRVGLGSGTFVALAAALQAPPGTAMVVEEGRERSFLAPLPVQLLPCSQEMQRRMGLLGLRTLGQLAGLPVGALAEQFGPEGMEGYRLARGMDEQPLIPRESPLLLEEEVEIDPPTDRGDRLLATASAMVDRLVARMRSGFLACREVALLVGFAAGPTACHSTTLHEPAERAEEILRAVGRLMGRISPLPNPSPTRGEGLSDLPLPPCGGEGQGEGGRISSLRLTLSGFGAQQGEQLGLFRSRAGSLQRVRRAVRQAEEQFGEGAIRPLAEMEGEKESAIPIPVIPDVIGLPDLLFLEGKRERVREVCNRWRVREEWWRREVYRDYYRLVTESGRLCVVYRDLTPQPPSPVGKGERALLALERGDTPFPSREGGRGVRSAPWFLERIYG